MPYRESDAPSREENTGAARTGWCPACRAEVQFAASDAIAICHHCDSRFATSAANRPPPEPVVEEPTYSAKQIEARIQIVVFAISAVIIGAIILFEQLA